MLHREALGIAEEPCGAFAMKINVNNIPPEGITQEEEVTASELDIETDTVKLHSPIKIKADVSRITNTITVDVGVNASIYTSCSRCLEEIEIDISKNFKLNYVINKSEPIIDLDPDIRDEIILDYPLKSLCNPRCKGLCPKCGKNLNEGKCSC